MKIRLLTMVVALAVVVLASSTADAAHVIYRRAVPRRVRIARPVVVAPLYPVLTPTTTTIVSPKVFIGPRGRIRYVTPVRTIVRPIYLR
jgi:hypothetical protein